MTCELCDLGDDNLRADANFPDRAKYGVTNVVEKMEDDVLQMHGIFRDSGGTLLPIIHDPESDLILDVSKIDELVLDRQRLVALLQFFHTCDMAANDDLT